MAWIETCDLKFSKFVQDCRIDKNIITDVQIMLIRKQYASTKRCMVILSLLGNIRLSFFPFSQIKQAEKQAMIEGIRENGSEAAEFVIKKVRANG